MVLNSHNIDTDIVKRVYHCLFWNDPAVNVILTWMDDDQNNEDETNEAGDNDE